MEPRKLYYEMAGFRPLDGESFRDLCQKALDNEAARTHNASLASLPDAADFEGEERWDNSTYRCAAPGGNIYTQWHRVFASGTLADGQRGAFEYHWKDEDGYNFKVTMVKSWIGEDSPYVFTTTAVKRDYALTNRDCVIS